MCNDPLIRELNAKFYSAVKMPDPELKPADILAQVDGKRTELYGDLAKYFPRNSSDDLKTESGPAPAISLNSTGQLASKEAMPILANYFSQLPTPIAIGAVEHLYADADYLSVSFEQCTTEKLSLGSIDSYMKGGSTNKLGPTGAEQARKGHLYIIFEVIRSPNFTISAGKKSKGALNVDVSVAKQQLGALKIKESVNTKHGLVYEFDHPLSFGFKAVKMIFDNDRYCRYVPVPASGVEKRSEFSTGGANDIVHFASNELVDLIRS